MKTMQKSIAAGVGSILVVAGAGSGIALAEPQENINQNDSLANQSIVEENSISNDIVQLESVNGSFSYSQQVVDTIEVIKKNLATASQYLCDSGPINDEGTLVDEWVVRVNGDVSAGFSAAYSELIDEETAEKITMMCSCKGNPTDGLAAINADIRGISVCSLVDFAQPLEGANTVVFSSSDGYKVEIPLSYLKQRYSLLVFDVNGAPLAESMGGVNQLWLGSTAASYFVRNVDTITIETRETPPPSPNSDEARESYANLPNIGVLFGGEVA